MNTPGKILRHVINTLKEVDETEIARFRVAARGNSVIHFRVVPQDSERLRFYMMHVDGVKAPFIESIFSGDRSGFDWLLDLFEVHGVHGHMPAITIVPNLEKRLRKQNEQPSELV